MTVRRTLPQRARSLVGAWCFADHYGPDDVAATGGMDVPPHPHTGLQTVSWLFSGEIEHRDTTGAHAIVRPGELNLMTGGSGVAHSEVSTPDTGTLHGVQLWMALPDAARHLPRSFVHHVPEVVPPRRCVRPGAARDAGRLDLPGAHAHPAARRRGGARPGDRARRSTSRRASSTGCWSTGGRSSSTASSWTARSSATCARTPAADPDQPGRPAGTGHAAGRGAVPGARASCGGTSSAAPTRRSPATARTGSPAPARFGQVEGYGGQVQRLPAPPLPTARLKARMAPPAPEDPSAWG